MFRQYIFPQLSVILLLISGLYQKTAAASVDSRNDSFYISHYTIKTDLTGIAAKSINGSCILRGISRIDKLNRLSLELYKLHVDSVLQNGKKLSFQYNDSLLTPYLDKIYNIGDTFEISVFYGGKPVNTSWGGFYFDASGQYAYNLGVGLYSIPHNFGRIWFPCVDNFIDKATYSFYINTRDYHKCYCNGVLIDSELTAGNTIIWHWEMNQAIPPYLASVAVGDYKTLYGSFTGKTGMKPVMIGVLPKDTIIAKSTFQHLNQVLSEYEGYYAAYPFDKVGFVSVNFGSGAMEHASNIALPNSAIESGLAEESLWAHELSHQWWGDLVTCKTAEDMWLNEGWATFNESLYQEKLYGVSKYNSYARDVHYYALRYAHVYDKSDRALSPMPPEYTYGITVYKKGADVARSLRGYLGDSMFFKGVQTYMKDFAYKSASSDDFKNSLSKSTGIDLTDFFHDWVYSPGWPHFEITQNTPDPAAHQFNITISERSLNNFSPYKNTPLEVNWFDNKWKINSLQVIPDASNSYDAKIPDNAALLALDINGKITDATTKEYQIIKKEGTYLFSDELLTIDVDSIKDSSLLYVVQHWIGAASTANTPKNIRLSGDRYWTIDGIFTAGFHAKATLIYDGRTFSTKNNAGYLDNRLLGGKSEDSIVLMYKPVIGGDWQLLKENIDYIKNTGASSNDEFGNIKIQNVKKGQYCLGIFDARAGSFHENPPENNMYLFPNPAANILHIKFKDAINLKTLQVYNLEGKSVKWLKCSSPASDDFIVRDLDLAMGTYILQATTNAGVSSKKFIVGKY